MNKMCSKCKESLELTSFYKQARAKDGLSAWCKSCKRADMREWTERNRESERERQREYYEYNRENKNAKNKLWQSKNKGKVNAITAKRRANKALATPRWLSEENLKEISNFYVEAARATELTNIKHEVDHIVPIQGKSVCGLHVPWNLQILTKFENLSKGNSVGKQS